MNVRRFGPVYEDRAFAAERARESYRYYYMLRYPARRERVGRASVASRPLDGRGLALGGVFGEKNGWERVNYYEPGRAGRRAGADQHAWGWGRPAFFDRVGEEHRAVRERAGLLDMTSFGKIDVRGPGALALLQRLCDNDVGKPPGSVVYTQFLNARGGIEADLTVIRLAEDRFRVVTGSGFVPGDLGWIRMHLPRDGLGPGPRGDRRAGGDRAVGARRARRCSAATTRDDVSNAAFPYLTRAVDPHRRGRGMGPARDLRRGARLGALRAGRPTRAPCGTRSSGPAGPPASRRWATRRSSRSGSRRATGTGAPTSRLRTTPTRPGSASACGWGRAISSAGTRSCGPRPRA